MKDNVLDYIGKTFCKLTIIGDAGQDKNLRTMVLIRCDCGVEKTVTLRAIKSGKTKSCGCLRVSNTIERNLKHGYTGTQLYTVWKSMKARCYRKNYSEFKYYGGRGITVCDEWKDDFLSFRKFAIENGWKNGLEIDRRDNDKGYSPDNCRIVTPQINSLNRGMNSNNTSGYRGVFLFGKTIKAECKIKGYPHLQKRGFKTAEEAAIYRDNFIIQHGIDTPLNFPPQEQVAL